MMNQPHRELTTSIEFKSDNANLGNVEASAIDEAGNILEIDGIPAMLDWLGSQKDSSPSGYSSSDSCDASSLCWLKMH